MFEIEIFLGLILIVIIMSALRGAHHAKIMRKLQLKQLEQLKQSNPNRKRTFWEWLDGE